MTEQDFPQLAPTSRFQVTERPLVTPGKCAVCGAVDRPVVDFNMTLQFYGAVLLCTTCLTEAGHAIGLVPYSDVQRLEESLAQSLTDQLKARNLKVLTDEQFDVVSDAVGHLSDVLLFACASDSYMVAGSSTEDESAIFEDPFGNDGESENSEPGATGSIEQDDNAAVGEGPISVPDDSSNGNSFVL